MATYPASFLLSMEVLDSFQARPLDLGDGPPCLFYGKKGGAGELRLMGRRQGTPVPSPLGSMTGGVVTDWACCGRRRVGAGAVLARRSGRVGLC